ncbi:hypothetical protein M7I_5850 [Glarea lozoyensis 74030]|uniref:Uncharacterized protein n=1 Tax=Glarea lozoyensis (strain ATCC 74030 / MF5533) TaxID=1104152 RepID=H0ESX7_GLAL7|nr:hypothetical protein M7I_5850 [Glarea lozoyensis 74030]
MSTNCPPANTLNQTTSSYNNICLLSGSPSVLSNATVLTLFNNCCTSNGGTYERRSDACYHECHISQVIGFQTVPDCIREINFKEEGGLAVGCFGDLKDNALMTLPPTGVTVSFNQSTATVNDASGVTATGTFSTGRIGSATITSAPKTTSVTASSTSAGLATSTSKASHAGGVSLK